MSDTYTDGIQAQRCIMCGTALEDKGGNVFTTVRRADIEDVLGLLVDYVDLPEVWGATITRFEQALGQSLKQIKARRCDQRRCDHKFIDSTACLKCGWTP